MSQQQITNASSQIPPLEVIIDQLLDKNYFELEMINAIIFDFPKLIPKLMKLKAAEPYVFACFSPAQNLTISQYLTLGDVYRNHLTKTQRRIIFCNMRTARYPAFWVPVFLQTFGKYF